VLLGASEFDFLPEFNNAAFRASKACMTELLSTEYLLGDEAKQLDLFDKEVKPDEIVAQVKEFSDANPGLTDFILYYCGHGVIRHPDTLCLLLRLSRRGREATTTLRLVDFQHDLRDELAGKRTFIFLDCCYAAAAVRDLMSGPSLSPLIARQIEVTGTALFAAASVDRAAKAPAGEKLTLFSGHLAAAIRNGVPGARERELTLSALAEYVRFQIQQEPEYRRVMPELHIPKQITGNVALVPLFRNRAPMAGQAAGRSEGQAQPPGVDARFNKRPHDVFLHYSHTDQARVRPLATWLQTVAGLEVAWDVGPFGGGSPTGEALRARFAAARTALFCVSRAWIASKGCEEAFDLAAEQRRADGRYRIILCRLDDCEMPAFLGEVACLDMASLEAEAATTLLQALTPEPARRSDGRRDIYLSRSWHAADGASADPLCDLLANRHHFRLIGDSPDYPAFDAESRLRRIIDSCGALVAVLPYRADKEADGFTSRFIVREAQLARDLAQPYLLFAAEGVAIDPALSAGAFGGKAFALPSPADDGALTEIVDRFEEEYRPSPRAAYSFFATSLRRHGEDTRRAVSIIEQVTNMQCLLGERLQGQSAQKEIIERIRGAEFVLADISGNDHNSLIEAGIARGAGAHLELICAAPESGDLQTRFMFRDLEVNWYGDSVERIGKVHRIARKYRRLVIHPVR
jgi:hypothetical protein